MTTPNKICKVLLFVCVCVCVCSEMADETNLSLLHIEQETSEEKKALLLMP